MDTKGRMDLLERMIRINRNLIAEALSSFAYKIIAQAARDIIELRLMERELSSQLKAESGDA